MGNKNSTNQSQKSNTTQNNHQRYQAQPTTQSHEQKQVGRINQPKQRPHSAPITQTQLTEAPSHQNNTASFAAKIQRDHRADQQERINLKKERAEARTGKYNLL